MNFREKTTAAFGIALAIFLTIASLSYRSVLRSDEDRMWVLHTREVREQANQILTDLLNAETGERGYILTGQEPFLVAYTLSIPLQAPLSVRWLAIVKLPNHKL